MAFGVSSSGQWKRVGNWIKIMLIKLGVRSILSNVTTKNYIYVESLTPKLSHNPKLEALKRVYLNMIDFRTNQINDSINFHELIRLSKLSF